MFACLCVCAVAQPRTIQLALREVGHTGKPEDIQCLETSTVGELKRILAPQLGVSSDRVRLILELDQDSKVLNTALIANQPTIMYSIVSRM